MLPESEINRVLVVSAHPDDADFGAAGTVALFGGRGVEVTYLIVTDGDAGGNERTLDHSGMAELRRAEQTAAAKCKRKRHETLVRGGIGGRSRCLRGGILRLGVHFLAAAAGLGSSSPVSSASAFSKSFGSRKLR